MHNIQRGSYVVCILSTLVHKYELVIQSRCVIGNRHRVSVTFACTCIFKAKKTSSKEGVSVWEGFIHCAADAATCYQSLSHTSSYV